MPQIHPSDSVHWYINELTSRVVAKSGNPSDRFHMGKLILQSFRDDPDFVAQIDGGTGQSETNTSVMKRSIQCAISFKKLGLKHGDVMVIVAPNHLDLAVLIYAAMYLGIIIAPVDRTIKINEFQSTFAFYNPAIIVCHSENLSNVDSALQLLGQTPKIVIFDKQSNKCCLNELLQADNDDIESFKPAEYSEDSIAVIVPTSGSSGLSKGAAITYKAWMVIETSKWACYTNFPTPSNKWMILPPIQWVTVLAQFISSPVMKVTLLLTSKTVTIDHARYLINACKPTITTISTTMMGQLLKLTDGPCDLTCFDTLMIVGSAVHEDIMNETKKGSPRTTIINGYGMTELGGLAFHGKGPLGSSGKPTGIYQYRLVDIKTQQDIHDPNINGELWIKGPGMFKEYYNNPQETKKAFVEDGWFKTGDLFYRDEHWNYYFVERIKMMMEYKYIQISPSEIEGVIRKHPGVLDVAVTSILDLDYWDLPVGCVITKQGYNVTAQEIVDLVAETLPDANQLRGGVVFMNSFPLLSTTKINRKKLMAMVREGKLK